MRKFVTIFQIFLALCSASSAIELDKTNVYTNAYYLFLAEPSRGCEDCYIPLLFTLRALEAVVEGQPIADCILLVTYERDSIWTVQNSPLTIDLKAVSKPERKISINQRTYRYQAVTKEEVLALLRKPGGTVPLSRPFFETHYDPKVLQRLISNFTE